MSKKRYYFDYAATTPLDPKVFSAMLPYFSREFGNPSNLYGLSRNASSAIAEATKTITKILGCEPDEFIYTGSATEADNLAILGIARNAKERWKDGKMERLKIIVSAVEHKGILNACEALEEEGFEVVKLPVLKNGLVDLEFLKKSLDEKIILVSVTMADSETSTIQPVAKISETIRNFEIENSLKTKNCKLKIYFHTDASQAAGYLDIDVNKLGVDLMTLSSHKIYGPKGVGGLYVKKGTKINPIIHGGGQQRGLRSGTENVPGIVGFAKALELVAKNKKQNNAKIKKMRDMLEKGIFKSISKVVLNGHPEKRMPNFLNISILDVEGEAMLLYLDELGIMVSTGSACNSQSLEPSYILTALGNSYEYIHGSLRFTLGRGNTMADVEYLLKHLPAVVKKLRGISPLELKFPKVTP